MTSITFKEKDRKKIRHTLSVNVTQMEVPWPDRQTRSSRKAPFESEVDGVEECRTSLFAAIPGRGRVWPRPKM